MRGWRALGVGWMVALGACVLPRDGLDPDFEIAERMPGLVAIHHDEFDRAFLRPRAELGTYRAVLLHPVQVEYYEPASQHVRIPTASTTERLADEVRETFAEELGGDGGYPLVEESGPGVLGIRLSLVNVEVDVTGSMSPGGGAGGARVATVGGLTVSNEGEYDAAMTLVIEVRDTESGLVLFWGRDRRSAPLGLRGSDRMALLSRGRVLARRWAEALRRGLGGPPAPPDRPPTAP